MTEVDDQLGTAPRIPAGAGEVDAALRLRLVQEAAGIGTWDWDLVTGALRWDAQCAALLGVGLGAFDATVEGFDARTHPDDLPRVHAALREAIDTAGTVELEYRAVWADGTVRRVLVRGQTLVDAEGRVVRLLGAVVDVTDFRAAVDAEAVAARRLADLAAFALQLAGAQTVDDLTDVVIERGLAAFGADGGAVAVRRDELNVVRLTMTGSLGPQARREYAELPLDGPLPASFSARTGRRVLLKDRVAGLAWGGDTARVYAATGKEAWAVLPLIAGGRLLGALAVAWEQPQDFPADEVELLEAFAAQCAQALDRIQVHQAERSAAAASRRLSEALQRSLLTAPPEPDHLEIAVRYLPAAQEAKVGGDWYDAFLTPDGSTVLVIGDVAGHDRTAAATMGQIRNVLRGVAYTLVEPPAAVLSALDRALRGLAVDTLATAVLAQVEQAPDHADQGLRVLHWSNAGHPPPLLIRPDGSVRLLEHEPDLLLGYEPAAPRADHQVTLEPGATVVMYTDGLVERRGERLDDGLERLRAHAAELSGLTLEQLCDALLAGVPDESDDDIALVAVRAL
jgi:serine phosphatase RsbU (regulator of sigma subunit)